MSLTDDDKRRVKVPKTRKFRELYNRMTPDARADVEERVHTSMRVLEVVSNAVLRRDALEAEYRWLGAFEADQLNDMAVELIEAYRKATRTADWEAFDAILHEWSESGWAALSTEHDEAFNAGRKEGGMKAGLKP